LKKKIGGLIAAILFFLSLGYIIGQYGALECDTITVPQFIIRTIIGLVVFGIDAYLINKFYSNEKDLQERQLQTGRIDK
jgi:uncharacterized protein with PQ loop repeat